MKGIRRFRDRAVRLLLIAAVCTAGAGVSVLAPLHDPHVRAQASRYVVLAESLAHGEYELTSSPLAETEVTVPPLWPAVLAAAYVLTAPESLADFVPTARGVTLVLFLVLLVAIFLFVEARAGAVAAAVVAGLTAVQPWLMPYAQNPMSEVPFTLLLMASLGAGAGALRRRAAGPLYLALGCALAAAFVRPAGLAAVLALVWRAWGAFPERRRVMVIFAAASLLWPVREGAVLLLGTPTASTTLEAVVHGLGDRSFGLAVADNVQFYATALVAAVFPTDLLQRPPVQGVLLVALWGLLALGAGRDRAHDRGLAVATCGVMALGLLLWPSHTVRYLVPLLPLVLLFAARGVRRAVVLAAGALGLIGRPLPARLAPILLLALLVPYLRWEFRARDASAREMTAFDPWRGFARTLAWVDAEVPADAVVVSRYAEDVFVRTGRQALPLERALRHPEADALNEGPLWLVRDAVEGPQRDDANDAVALSRAGGRIRYVESDSGTEVWILPANTLERLREGFSNA